MLSTAYWPYRNPEITRKGGISLESYEETRTRGCRIDSDYYDIGQFHADPVAADHGEKAGYFLRSIEFNYYRLCGNCDYMHSDSRLFV